MALVIMLHFYIRFLGDQKTNDQKNVTQFLRVRFGRALFFTNPSTKKLHPLFPAFGVAAHVHNSNHQQAIRSELINYAVRES